MRGVCKIKGCKNKVVAKRLCAKHYMRKRRTGDPHETRKPGRKQDEQQKRIQDMFREWSPRTQARFCAAMRLLNGIDQAEAKKVIERATRRNGSMSVLRLYETAVVLYIDAHPDEFEDDEDDMEATA